MCDCFFVAVVLLNLKLAEFWFPLNWSKVSVSQNNMTIAAEQRHTVPDLHCTLVVWLVWAKQAAWLGGKKLPCLFIIITSWQQKTVLVRMRTTQPVVNVWNCENVTLNVCSSLSLIAVGGNWVLFASLFYSSCRWCPDLRHSLNQSWTPRSRACCGISARRWCRTSCEARRAPASLPSI